MWGGLKNIECLKNEKCENLNFMELNMLQYTACNAFQQYYIVASPGKFFKDRQIDCLAFLFKT